jgi:hypothetical protein
MQTKSALSALITLSAACMFLTVGCSESRQIGITEGRARANVAALVGLVSLVSGALALVRSGDRVQTKRVGAIVALVLGVSGMILSALHLSSSTGGFGTGSGRAGAIVALVLGLVGVNLGGLALVRSRRSG